MDMPTREVDGWKEVDARAVATFIRAQRESHPGAELQAALEKVGARPGDGSTSAFRFGDSYGQARAVLQVMGVPDLRAIPAVWKRRFGLISQERDAARLLAIQRFPVAALQLQRKKDNGRADALLIALWAEHQLAMGQVAA
ncbi:hypothetical protein I5W21_06835 [Stenotrophomonas maltophilia]|nr:hypothetical protein [Stenotrophomonas maltophilia]